MFYRQQEAQSLDRNARRGQSQRTARAQSTARCENNLHHSKAMPEISVRDYTMTLPASRGRHRSRVNGEKSTTDEWLISGCEKDDHIHQITWHTRWRNTQLKMMLFLLEKRAQSVDPRTMNSKDAPVLCNKYAIDDLTRRESLTEQRENRSRSMPRSPNNRKHLYSPSREASPEPIPKRLHPSERSRYLAPPLPPDMHDMDECIELEVPVKKHKRRDKSPLPPMRIMSPMGFAVHRQARLMETYDEEAGYDDDYIDFVSDAPVRPVPIWLCVFLVIGYIIAGAFYFHRTEKWEFLDSAYFCFITLTTIGEIQSLFCPTRSHKIAFFRIWRFRASARIKSDRD